MFDKPRTVEEIAAVIGGRVEGDGGARVASIESPEKAGPDALTFAEDGKNLARLAGSGAGAAVVAEGAEVTAPMPLIRVKQVQAAVAAILAEIAPPEDLPGPGVHPSAAVAGDAGIARDVAIGPHVTVNSGACVGRGSVLCPGVFIGRNASVGEQSVLCQGAVVRSECVVGSRVRVGPNSVIGYDGFGYFFSDGAHNKVPHAGNAVIEDDVELGACVCVDRAKWGSTVVGAGSKLDNLVQIAHNAKVGPGTVMAGLTGVAGSAELGKFMAVGGHVGIRDNITLGDGTQVGACSCVAESFGPGEVLLGTPAIDANRYKRVLFSLYKLPELMKRIKKLERKLESGGAGEDDTA